MRYRRLSYRYAVVMATGRPRSLGEAWQRQPASISMGHSFWRPPADVVDLVPRARTLRFAVPLQASDWLLASASFGPPAQFERLAWLSRQAMSLWSGVRS